MAFRVDKITLRPAKRLPNGSLRVDGVLTRTGVFEYRNGDGSVRKEYRPPEEVFKTDSIESFAMVPVTNDHPSEPITPENAKRFAVGAVGETIKQDGDLMIAPMVVYDAEAIAAMEAGKVQLSNGYSVDLDETPGVAPNGDRYDAVQRNIRGNHVAIVEAGRAGNVASVRMDTAFLVESNSMDLEQAKQRIADLEIEKIGLEAKVSKAEADRDREKARADKAEADRDSEKARADKAEKAREDAKEGEADRVRARVELEGKAKTILGEEFKVDASDRDLKVAVIAKVDGAFEAGEKSDDYIQARYDRAIEVAGKAGEGLGKARKFTEDNREDGKQDREGEARAKMIQRNRSLIKGDK